jgi:hypothetical protein
MSPDPLFYCRRSFNGAENDFSLHVPAISALSALSDPT